MKFFVLNRKGLLMLTTVWWYIFLAFIIADFNTFQIWNVVGFLFLSLVPGMLTVQSLRLKKIPFFATLSLSVAFSILELMVIALLGNFILPMLGIAQPLTRTTLMFEVSLLYIILAVVAWLRLADWKLDIPSNLKVAFPNFLEVAIAFLPALFVLQSVVGAFRLNNGQSGTLTWLMIGEIAIYILVLYIFSNKLSENTIPTALYFIGLSLLLMTSLRGWYITGHDIQTEYKVFELTKNHGMWNMAFYQDAYNACLSITILPTVFYNLLKISDPYIYKFIFQLFFALCAGITYIISRHWASKRLSLLAGMYFFTFPTFFADMPFLVRQEIAFIFYGLMLYFAFEKQLGYKMRQSLFVLCGVGVILSHYSTTYTTLLIFTLTYFSRLFIVKFYPWISERWNLFKRSTIILPKKNEPKAKPNITLTMVSLLFFLSFLWTGLITNTGGNIRNVLKATISAVISGATENNRSTDATNLLSFRKPSQQEEFDTYIKKVILPIRNLAEKNVYYDEAEYGSYAHVALPDENLPLTALGKLVRIGNFDFSLVSTLFGRGLAKFMEILAPLSVLYLLFRKGILKSIDLEYYLLGVFALVFIALIIFVPVLSTEYGIFRAMQQSMYLLALPMIVGGCVVGVFLEKISNFFRSILFRIFKNNSSKVIEKSKNNFQIVLALLFFLYSTAFIPQMFGNNPAMLYFSNTGRYYDNYLIKPSEVAGVAWLSNLAKNNVESVSGVKIQIQTDQYSQRKMASLSSIDAYHDIFPGTVRKDAYIFLGESVTLKQRATLVFGGDQITYKYPVEFLDLKKNLIYNSGRSRVYK